MDYQLLSNTATYTNGDNADKTLSLRIFDDGEKENAETIILSFTISGIGVVAGPANQTFTATITDNDKGETAKEGSLLVAQYGKGYYVYTGISFFRELPEGVAGDYKLFANIVYIGK